MICHTSIISYYYYSSNSNKRNWGHSEKMDKNKCPFFLFGMENLFLKVQKYQVIA